MQVHTGSPHVTVTASFIPLSRVWDCILYMSPPRPHTLTPPPPITPTHPPHSPPLPPTHTSSWCGPLGGVKLAVVVVLSCALLHDRLTPLNTAGFVITVVAFATQSHLYNNHLCKQRARALDAAEQLEREDLLVDEDPLLRKSMSSLNGGVNGLNGLSGGHGGGMGMGKASMDGSGRSRNYSDVSSHSSKSGWGECATGSGGSGDMNHTSEQGRRRVNMTRLIFILEATLALFVLLVVLSFFLVERAGQDKGGQLEVRAGPD